jgi:hypothetical protein
MIGWIMLSRQAVASAEAALRSDELGVRDEVGFLNLHQAFSDRFFPGTSVLHTRLRYALFVPWLMAHAQGDAAQLRKHELALTWQLNQGADKRNGVIGGTIWPRAPSQPASMIYWTALARWKILQPRPDGVNSSRGEILKRIAATHRYALGRHRMDDGEPAIEEDLSPFVKLPEPPSAFLKAGESIDFTVTPQERAFLRRQLIGVGRGPEQQSMQSLLARLADIGLPEGQVIAPWSKAIRSIADVDDQKALKVARQSAALAGIGRAVYAALVEAAKANDGSAHTTRHREDVRKLVAEHADDAKVLDLSELHAFVPGLPDYLANVLSQTQKWLLSGTQNVLLLRAVYQEAEVQRKGSRARLANTLGGQRRRAEWSADAHPLAEPLHFRWGNVRRLLIDLKAP